MFGELRVPNLTRLVVPNKIINHLRTDLPSDPDQTSEVRPKYDQESDGKPARIGASLLGLGLCQTRGSVDLGDLSPVSVPHQG